VTHGNSAIDKSVRVLLQFLVAFGHSSAGRRHTFEFPVVVRGWKEEVTELMQITKLYTVFDIYFLLRGI
jgi:hypothetical protein